MRYRLTNNDKLRRMLRDYPLATKEEVETISLTPGPPGAPGDPGPIGPTGTTSTPVVQTQTATFVDTTPYTVQANDVILYVHASVAPIVIDLPVALASLRTLTIKKVDATTNAVTVTAPTANIIDGATTQVIDTQYTSLTIHDATANTWYIL